jgi:hypothetical protein
VAADQVWNGATVEARVQALVGVHGAELTWWTEPPGSAGSTALDLEDRIAIVVAYSGAAGTVTCAGSLEVPVDVGLSSEVSGISEHGPGTLTFTTSAEPAQLSYSVGGLTLSVRLEPIAAQMPPAGDLNATRDELPGDYATIGEGP